MIAESGEVLIWIDEPDYRRDRHAAHGGRGAHGDIDALPRRLDVAEAEAVALRIRNDTLEAIIRGASEQLGQGDIPLAVAIAQLHVAHADAWKLIGRCDMALELVEVARSIRGAQREPTEMRAEIKKASRKESNYGSQG